MPDEQSEIHKQSRRLPTVATLIGIGGLIGVIIVGTLVTVHVAGKSTVSVLPAATVKRISGFKPYYFKPGSEVVLDNSSIVYDAGVLVFSIKGPTGKPMAVTEESIPKGFDVSGLKADQQFQSNFGQCFVADKITRTTGALFTTDGTWILINAPTPIGADSMHELLTELRPVALH